MNRFPTSTRTCLRQTTSSSERSRSAACWTRTRADRIDLLIAAHTLALDLTLVTANAREFSRVPQLRTENWLLL